LPLAGPGELEVVVTGGGAPLAGAAVCACAPGIGVYAVGQTDDGGRALLSVEPAGAGTITLTVTAKNRIPYSASVQVSEVTSVVDAPVTALFQNAPNPFSVSTEIAFALGERAAVSISVFDVSGRRVAVLTDGERAAGRHSVRWDGLDDQGQSVAAGTYFVRMVAGASRFDRKITVLK
jgi:hypothetical protein